ncbi:MAG: DUF998 domain-containing protein [Nitrosopumilus sp.]|nr:DUF998 domain-containing protein [Nitrosopumilus sp.]MDH3487046.1 DUF998 domain-containing protein [Nitrosopumilus sp.]
MALSSVTGSFGVIIALGVIIIALVTFPNFSWYVNSISSTIAEGVKYSFWYNLGIMLAGVLFLMFSFSLLFTNGALIWRNKWLTLTGIISFMIASIGLFGAGVYPSPHNEHIYVAGVFFLFSIIALFCFGSGLNGNMRMWSYGLFIVALIGFFLMLGLMIYEGVYGKVLFGLEAPELVVIISIVIWVWVIIFEINK